MQEKKVLLIECGIVGQFKCIATKACLRSDVQEREKTSLVGGEFHDPLEFSCYLCLWRYFEGVT